MFPSKKKNNNIIPVVVPLGMDDTNTLTAAIVLSDDAVVAGISRFDNEVAGALTTRSTSLVKTTADRIAFDASLTANNGCLRRLGLCDGHAMLSVPAADVAAVATSKYNFGSPGWILATLMWVHLFLRCVFAIRVMGVGVTPMVCGVVAFVGVVVSAVMAWKRYRNPLLHVSIFNTMMRPRFPCCCRCGSGGPRNIHFSTTKHDDDIAKAMLLSGSKFDETNMGSWSTQRRTGLEETFMVTDARFVKHTSVKCCRRVAKERMMSVPVRSVQSIELVSKPAANKKFAVLSLLLGLVGILMVLAGGDMTIAAPKILAMHEDFCANGTANHTAFASVEGKKGKEGKTKEGMRRHGEGDNDREQFTDSMMMPSRAVQRGSKDLFFHAFFGHDAMRRDDDHHHPHHQRLRDGNDDHKKDRKHKDDQDHDHDDDGSKFIMPHSYNKTEDMAAAKRFWQARLCPIPKMRRDAIMRAGPRAMRGGSQLILLALVILAVNQRCCKRNDKLKVHLKPTTAGQSGRPVVFTVPRDQGEAAYAGALDVIARAMK